MRILLYFLLLGLALQHVCSIPIARSEEDDELLEVKSHEEEGGDEIENEEETVEESGSGSGSKRNLIEEEVKEDDDAAEGESDVAVGKDAITKADDVPDEGDNQDDETNDNQEKESEEEKEETKKTDETPEEEATSKTELTKKTEVPSMEDEDEQGEESQEVEEKNGDEDNAPTEENPSEEVEEENTGSKRSDLCKRWGHGCDEEGHEEGHEGHGHHHGHHEHEHEHHHHGHHHGFVHEWGEEEGGGHHGHQGHGHHEGHHEHEHEHEHGYGGYEGIGHHGGYGGGGWGGGGYGDGGYGGGYGGGGCGGGCGGGWGRSSVEQAPPMAFHCRDMVSKDGKKHTKRFCVPIGYNGGYGWPYFHGYPGTGLGQWGWGFPWIKSKVEGSKGVKSKDSKKEKSSKKVQRDHITKKQTVHVGYGYASGDNYRLGFQAGGMGGLASTFTGHLGPATLPDHFKKSVINKRQFGFGGPGTGPVGAGPVDAPGYGGHSTPYGHPVTHPGFTTMGYPGHALASTDVRSGIQRPKRDIDDEAMIPEDNFQVEDPEKEFANYQYYESQPIENEEENENTFLYSAE